MTMQQRPVFGRKKPPVEADARRRDVPAGSRAFDGRLFHGPAGALLRKHGFHPDEPHNIVALQEPVAAQLAAGSATMRTIVAGFAEQLGWKLEVVYLLPVELWRGALGPELVQRLGMLPHRPWNALILPGDSLTADQIGVPEGVPKHGPEAAAKAASLAEMILEQWQGRTSPEAEAMAAIYDNLAGEHPRLFPADTADMRPETALARRRLRIAAGMMGLTDLALTPATIASSHETFLQDPARQLVVF